MSQEGRESSRMHMVSPHLVLNEDILMRDYDAVNGTSQFRLRRSDMKWIPYGTSTSHLLAKATKDFLKDHPDAEYDNLLRVQLTESEIEEWSSFLDPDSAYAPGLTASWKRWGFTPDAGAYLHGRRGIKAGNMVYDLLGPKPPNLHLLDYFLRDYPANGLTTGMRMAKQQYRASYEPFRKFLEGAVEMGMKSLPVSEILEYACWHTNDGGKPAAGTSMPVLKRALQANMPSTVLYDAWVAGFGIPDTQSKIVDLWEEGQLRAERVTEYSRLSRLNGWDHPSEVFFQIVSSDIPFEWIELAA